MGSIDSHQANKTPFHKEESKIWTERGSKDYLVTSFALFLGSVDKGYNLRFLEIT
ncbi:hypothetical protein [Zymomonas mobilis]|uniref:hypothetical protein n=1 Tax=Zymomonas mobilis TaxID=542 RepID=UPI0001A7816D|nr:hypothetical protein [Zymomonas mobilis]TQL27465.1 hypothetical protein FBY55_0784 [Zymomonas mobilis]